MDDLTFLPAPSNDVDLVVHGVAATAAGTVNPSPTPSCESNNQTQEHLVGQLIDRYGHVHSEAIFENWSPAALKALGIRRVGTEDGAR
jgi:hypothetical protein